MALGRGLGELLGEVEIAYENNIDIDTNQIKEVLVDDIKPNPYQPRKIFDEEKLQELSESIKNHGLLQPIILVKDENFKYIVVAGERRLRATKLANIDTIKAIILDIDEKKLREYALIENIQRSDLNILEIAYSYGSLINEHNITHDELAKMVSKSRSSVTNILRLLSLSVYTQQMISANKITHGHAKLIIGLSEDEQKMVVDSIIGQRLSVRETEKLVRDIKSKDNISKNNTKEIKKYDFSPLKSLIKELKDDNFNVRITKDSINIKITSQDDIENLLKYFNKKDKN